MISYYACFFTTASLAALDLYLTLSGLLALIPHGGACPRPKQPGSLYISVKDP